MFCFSLRRAGCFFDGQINREKRRQISARERESVCVCGGSTSRHSSHLFPFWRSFSLFRYLVIFDFSAICRFDFVPFIFSVINRLDLGLFRLIFAFFFLFLFL